MRDQIKRIIRYAKKLSREPDNWDRTLKIHREYNDYEQGFIDALDQIVRFSEDMQKKCGSNIRVYRKPGAGD